MTVDEHRLSCVLVYSTIVKSLLSTTLSNRLKSQTPPIVLYHINKS